MRRDIDDSYQIVPKIGRYYSTGTSLSRVERYYMAYSIHRLNLKSMDAVKALAFVR